MKKIELTNGLQTMVDDNDFDYLNSWNWSSVFHRNTHYVCRYEKIDGIKKRIFMHRVIMNTPVGLFTDHKDHNGLNNQRDNLRICTNSQNKMNVRPTGRINYLGVYFEEDKYYRAKIRVNGKSIHLGLFKTPEDAAVAYNEAAKKYFGEFANLNQFED